MTSIQKMLLEIQESGSFELLEKLRKVDVWGQMAPNEKELFSFLLLKLGTQQLQSGDLKVLNTFSLAAEVAPSFSIYYQQGLIFMAHSENVRCVEWAIQSFEKAIKYSPDSTLGWYAWADACAALGKANDELYYLMESDKKFAKAVDLLYASEDIEISKEEFHYKWGNCLFFLGKNSGEPVDFHRAINQYRIALDLGCNNISFFNNYGQALCELGSLLERKEFYQEGLKFFEKIIEADSSHVEGWHNLAVCLLRLNELSGYETFFEQASLCFERAVGLDPTNSHLWLKWAILDTGFGKIKRSRHRLEESLVKYAKAHELEPECPFVLSHWADVELFLGSNQENIEFIHSAKNKILKSLEIQRENPDSWFIYGSCLNELGRYFEEEKFYYQAIEKFHYGLSLAPRHTLLWYGLALSHFLLGDLNDELSFYEKAVRYCSKVVECGGEVVSQFWNDWGVTLLKLAEFTDEQTYVELAIEKFEKAFKGISNSEYGNDVDIEWIYNYGCAFDLLGEMTEEPAHYEKAIAILSQVLQADSSYTHARYNLALAFSHLGENLSDVDYYLKALEHFHILSENDPEDEMVHMDYGIALVNLGLLVQDAHTHGREREYFYEGELHLLYSASLGNTSAYYHLAGLYSLTSQHIAAMHYMEKAEINGTLPPLDELMVDEWLEGLRHTLEFRQFLHQLSTKPSKEESL